MAVHRQGVAGREEHLWGRKRLLVLQVGGYVKGALSVMWHRYIMTCCSMASRPLQRHLTLSVPCTPVLEPHLRTYRKEDKVTRCNYYSPPHRKLNYLYEVTFPDVRNYKLCAV